MFGFEETSIQEMVSKKTFWWFLLLFKFEFEIVSDTFHD